MRLLFISLFVFSYTGFSQTYFFEDFNYENFTVLDSLYQNDSKIKRWSTHHAVRNFDLNEDRIINNEELFKNTNIVADPFDKDNKIIRFELNKIDPLFYAKYSCDDSENNNVKEDSKIMPTLDSNKNLYCSDCSDSPLGYPLYEYKTHMNRNELAIQGAKRKLYKVNRDHWFGLKMLIDEEYELDTDNNGEIVTQFHISGRKAVNPPVALLVVKGRFKLALIKNNDGKSEVVDLGPVEKGKWISWKYHIVLSKKEEKGLIEIWRDGEKMTTINGKNVFKNYRAYLKIGIYKWGWWDCKVAPSNTSKKVISFDKIWAFSEDRAN